MSPWPTIILAGLATFAIRLTFIFLLDRLAMPEWFRRGLRFVPVAVLSAIILPEMVTYRGAPAALVAAQGGLLLPAHALLPNPQLIAGGVAVLVAWRTRNVLATIAAGMAVLVAWRVLLG